MKKPTKIIAALGLTLLTSALAAFASAPTENYIVISANDNPESNVKLAYQIKPDQIQESAFYISNLSTDQETKLTLYTANPLAATDGGLGFDTPENALKSTTYPTNTWINIKETQITLKPHEGKIIPFTIKVPANQPSGTYIAGIAAEIQKTNTNSGIKIKNRTVEPVLINIPGKKIVDYKIGDLKLTDQNNKLTFAITNQNLGNNLLKIEGNIEIKNLSGQTIRTVYLPTSTLLSNEIRTASAETENNLFGTYKAKLNLTVKDYNFEKNQEITLQTIQKEISINFFNIGKILIILGIIIAILAIWLTTQFKHTRIRRNATTHIVETGETITSIAKLYSKNWKQIAKLNKLRKPYTLKAGRSIKIPK